MKIRIWSSPSAWGFTGLGLAFVSLAVPFLILAQSPQPHVERGYSAGGPANRPVFQPANYQQPQPSRLPPPPAEQPATPPPPVLCDPTVVEPDLRSRLDPLTPPNATSDLPNIAVRGRILSGRRSVAVLDVGGKYFTVQEGSRVDAVPGSLTLLVRNLTDRGTTLVVEQQGREIRLP